MTVPTLHASCVAINGRAVLITGPSGAGKSDLALRLIDRGAVLVADDYCDLSIKDDRLFASPPDRIAGLIELRGIGICATPFLTGCEVAMVVRLVPEPARMPAEDATIFIAGQQLPVIEVNAYAASAPILVEWGLSRIQDGNSCA
ncbi:HPr kinase/phosphorylase [Aquisediminimonas sediminicola]|uniref:HPr kinase/phosphorylase n=1 Tax=Alteraquisediminimonas sediminicola TaxID=2676787 RepID=UPI001C8DC151|nr:HPr kinase/phosphatase C-terminal domain-containing protein [Aquisediminimonas sediminicola]